MMGNGRASKVMGVLSTKMGTKFGQCEIDIDNKKVKGSFEHLFPLIEPSVALSYLNVYRVVTNFGHASTCRDRQGASSSYHH